ncbi:hypothetical protein A3Q56_08194 [Intoshia linei]|uniref:DNA2/NAM7 helicase-like C-terminal domain-containing protein n=1 Tax=Intoshia linei TaxID=1819745 RepID=A0A177AQ37_9BILA|nr:hypothetical protein A3Q56_08194 [Intoshia linei]
MTVLTLDCIIAREKDNIIFSAVRSNNDNKIGFLSNYKKLNIAITRAKFGLFIIGNAMLLSNDKIWKGLICHCKYRRVLVKGKFNNLKLSNIKFPAKYIPHKSHIQQNNDTSFNKDMNNITKRLNMSTI